MRVRIDAAREHEFAGGVDNPRRGARPEVGADLGDGVAHDSHIGVARAVGIHDSAAPNQQFGGLGRIGPESQGGQADRTRRHQTHRLPAREGTHQPRILALPPFYGIIAAS